MIPTREHNASASSMECVVRMAPRLPLTFLLIVFLVKGGKQTGSEQKTPPCGK